MNNKNSEKIKNDRLNSIMGDLPCFCKDFFRGIDQTTSINTKIGYAYDIRTFFEYISSKNSKEITLDVLDELQTLEIEKYMQYLKCYTKGEKEYCNGERGLHRKLSTIRKLYLYFQKRGMIHNNPTLAVDMPKIHDKEIIRMDKREVDALMNWLNTAENNLTGRKRTFFAQNKLRNIAIFSLFLGTGIRVSELVGINMDDVDFFSNKIRVLRKGGKEDYVYFGENVGNALKEYIKKSRSTITPVSNHDNALFLSIQKRRISVQAVENLVHECARQVTTLKHITPHKLRSTYGTNLYNATGDIYLVAEVLGHNDVNTTRKHYAAIKDERKRLAASVSYV